MISSQPSFISELYLPTFVSMLDANDLGNIEQGLRAASWDTSVSKEEFCDLLADILLKGRRVDYEELFDLVDISREGVINWDMFSTHLLREYYEKEDRVRQSKTPQWTSLKYIEVPHRNSICTVRLSSLSYRYCSVSKDGTMCLMDRNFKILRTEQIKTDPEQIRPKDLWITDAVLMQNINKIVFCNTSKQILVYDLSNKTEFNCIYVIGGLKFIPMCLTYWSNPRKPSLAMLAFGDAEGGVHVLFFSNATLSLFDKPLKDSDQQICYELNLDDVVAGKFPSVTYMWYKAHTSWVRQIVYQPFLDCLISSSTTSRDSMVLSWLGKARNDSRLSTFAISVGINGFDYHEKFCLIATAGINNHVCLWNPYVVSKPVGRLEGHVQVVLAVQFIGVDSQLISFARDNVLRIWDVNNQTCLQTLTQMFPGNITSDVFILFDEETSSLLASLNHQLVSMKKKVETKDRVVSHVSPVTDVVYNSKYNQIISVCEGSSITVWLVSTGQKVKHIPNAHGDAEITAVTLNHAQTHVLTGGTDGLIRRWDINGNCSNVLVCDGGRPCEINKIIYLKRTILVFGWTKEICCFSVTGFNSYKVQPTEWKGKANHQDDILAADFIEPKHLVTGSYDGDIVFWNTSTHNSPRKIANSKNRTNTLPPITSPSGATNINSSRRRGSARVSSSRLRCRSVSARARVANDLDENNSVSLKPMSPLLRVKDESALHASTNLAVTSISFLQSRDNRDPQTADIYSSHADGHIRFWNSLTCELVGEFVAFDQYGSVASCVDTSNTYLGAGGETGACKIWNISEYCLNTSGVDVVHSPIKRASHRVAPSVVSSFVAHVDTVTCTRFIEQRNLVLFLTASCDCSIALYHFSVLIGVFGQDDHWNINDHKFLQLSDGTDAPHGKLFFVV